MGLEIESRPSDSPFVERVWRSRSVGVEGMMAVATARWDLVVWEERGRVSVGVVGPESRARLAPVPEESAFFGISFSLGTSMPHLPVSGLVDTAAELPDVTRRSFWLHGSTWHLPDYDNAEAFVRRLAREGVLARDPLVAAAAGGEATATPPHGETTGQATGQVTGQVTERTLQRRFVAATGLTQGAVRQIDRARNAAILLQAGVPALDVVHRLGYFDQPHLARSLRRFVGRTATQLRAAAEAGTRPAEPLSLLYKT